MTFEEAKDKAMLYSIDPSLTCSCDEVHVCQQCVEAYEEGKRIRLQNTEDAMIRSTSLWLEKLQPNNSDIDTSNNIIVDTSKIKSF